MNCRIGNMIVFCTRPVVSKERKKQEINHLLGSFLKESCQHIQQCLIKADLQHATYCNAIMSLSLNKASFTVSATRKLEITGLHLIDQRSRPFNHYVTVLDPDHSAAIT
eukprot:NODE_81_length_22753_cov_0.207072.p12 type:complete len:109 gc:universal NODE_81_length_22753_cov_0.207072:213-539(+)